MATQVNAGLQPISTDVDLEMLSDSGHVDFDVDIDVEFDEAAAQDGIDGDIDFDDADQYDQQPDFGGATDEIMYEEYDDNVAATEVDNDTIPDEPMDDQHTTQAESWTENAADSAFAQDLPNLTNLDSQQTTEELTFEEPSNPPVIAAEDDTVFPISLDPPNGVRDTEESIKDSPVQGGPDDSLGQDIHHTPSEPGSPSPTESNDLAPDQDNLEDSGASPHDDAYHEEEYRSYAYVALVNYQEHTMSLFPPSGEGLPATYLLQDSSLAEASLHDLLAACRKVLGATVDASDALCIDVLDLHLSISEVDSDCANVTISQIIDVYHRLHNNEEVYEPEPFTFTLSAHPRLSTRLSTMLSAADAGTGFSSFVETLNGGGSEDQVDSEQNEIVDPDQAKSIEENVLGDVTAVDNPSFEEAIAEGEELWQDDEHEAAATESAIEATGEVDQLIAQTDAEANILEQTTSSDLRTVTSVSSPDRNLESGAAHRDAQITANPAEDSAIDDDLIDYSDDEDDVGTSRSSTIQAEQLDNDSTAEIGASKPDSTNPAHTDDVAEANPSTTVDTVNDNELLFDFDDNVIDEFSSNAPQIMNPSLDAQSIAEAIETHDNMERQTESLNHETEIPQVISNDDDLLDFGEYDDDFVTTTLDSTLSKPSGVPGQEALADEEYNFEGDALLEFTEDLDEIPQTEESSSPLGKRTWDDHAEGTAAAENGQDVKRVKSA